MLAQTPTPAGDTADLTTTGVVLLLILALGDIGLALAVVYGRNWARIVLMLSSVVAIVPGIIDNARHLDVITLGDATDRRHEHPHPARPVQPPSTGLHGAASTSCTAASNVTRTRQMLKPPAGEAPAATSLNRHGNPPHCPKQAAAMLFHVSVVSLTDAVLAQPRCGRHNVGTPVHRPTNPRSQRRASMNPTRQPTNQLPTPDRVETKIDEGQRRIIVLGKVNVLLAVLCLLFLAGAYWANLLPEALAVLVLTVVPGDGGLSDLARSPRGTRVRSPPSPLPSSPATLSAAVPQPLGVLGVVRCHHPGRHLHPRPSPDRVASLASSAEPDPLPTAVDRCSASARR